MKSFVLVLLVNSCVGYVTKLRVLPTQLQADNATVVVAKADNPPTVAAKADNAPTFAAKADNATTVAAKADNATTVAASAVKVPEAGADGGKGEQYPARRVSMQIPETEVQDFLSKLSPGCEEQYTHMFNGQGSGLATFGSQGGEVSPESCKALNGSLCDTMANVAQKSQNSSGRKMKSTVDVTGKGCLPNACISGDDLAVLANFMRTKAKSSGTISGQGVRFHLHVDCTKSGGSVAESSDPAPEEEKEHHEEEEKEHHEESPKTEEHDADTDHEHEADAHHEQSEAKEGDHKSEAKSFAFRLGAGLLLPAVGVSHMLV